MALFSETIVYRSSLTTAEALKRVENAIETKGITHLEYWTEPAKFFRGKVSGNSFHIVSTGRRQLIRPSVNGIVENTSDGSFITVKIKPFLGAGLLLYWCALMLFLLILSLFHNQLFIVAFVAVIALVASMIGYRWGCWSAKIRLEDIFQTNGEEQ